LKSISESDPQHAIHKADIETGEYLLGKRTQEEQDQERMKRLPHDGICATCGKTCIKHPFHTALDWDGNPYLHVLCDGTLAKL
jgi:uncharacterized cysteine cluster protein YcgN (CxxCxxCC family)